MSDQELNVVEDMSTEVASKSVPPKEGTGMVPGVVLAILKWAAVALGVLILASTATLVTYRIVSGRTLTGTVVGQRQPYAAARPLSVYFDLGTIRGATADATPAYFTGIVKIGYAEDRKEVADELVRRREQLKNAIEIRLSQKKFESLRPARYEEIQMELAIVVNGLLSSGKVQEVLLNEFTPVLP